VIVEVMVPRARRDCQITSDQTKGEEIDAMTKHIELKKFNQATALATGTLALPPLVIEGLAEF
jgi:hypothetical protein